MCPHTMRPLLFSQRGAPSPAPEEAWETWRTAAEHVAELLRSATQSAPAGPSSPATLLGALPDRGDLGALAAHQRGLGDLARQLESDLDRDGHVSGLAAMSGWREAYADMVTTLAMLRQLSGPGSRLVDN